LWVTILSFGNELPKKVAENPPSFKPLLGFDSSQFAIVRGIFKYKFPPKGRALLLKKAL
jgi:hypothetical protein